MLKRDRQTDSRNVNNYGAAGGLALIGPADVLRVLKRQWPVIVAATVLCLLLAGLFLVTAAPKYTATMTLLIDTRKTQLLQSQLVLGEMALDASGVESQAEILRSDTIAARVVQDLKLTEDPEFVGGSQGFIASILAGLFGGNAPRSTELTQQLAVEQLQRNLQVKRVGLTYAIEVGYTALEAAKAKQIANAIGEAYLVSEMDSRYQATRRASQWLQDRMQELRNQVSTAETEVQQFKVTNNIIDTSRGLISEQQLGDLNTQLSVARAATAESKARLDRIQNITKDGGDAIADGTVTDALRNEVITRLRAQYLDLSAREADWSARYGRNHNAAVNLRNQMSELVKSMRSELARIAQTYASDYEIARARELSLEGSFNASIDQSAVTSQAQIKLRDLESRSNSLRNLYDNFSLRNMEAVQQQTYPASEARIISPASEPLRKSSPKSLVIIAVALVGGLGLGGAAAFVREQMDNVFRESTEMEQVTGIECLGILPRVEVIRSGDVQPADPERRRLGTDLGIAHHVVEAPFSRFTETLRNVKVAIDIAGLQLTTRVIGIASALPEEGKTTVASNLANLIASNQQRVLLIDADLRNPALTRAIAPDARVGLIEVIQGRVAEQDAIWVDPITGLHMLPAVVGGRISHTADLISSDAMAKLLIRLRERYDRIILDLPPVLPVVDVKAASHLIDGFVFVTAWGKTQKDVVLDALDQVGLQPGRAIGSVLNGAGQGVLRRLEAADGRYYSDYHNGYGYRGPKA